jgi:hypothetical protein
VRGGLGEESIPVGWIDIRTVASESGGHARIGIRSARSGDLVDSYPAGTHDREFRLEGDVTARAVTEIVTDVLSADPRCRRIVLPVPAGDLDAIGWAEQAGFRYVVDVDTREAHYSLLVIEPDWVVDQPSTLEDIPIKDGITT